MQLSDRFQEALGWAVEVHGDQRRKGTQVPYVSHLMAVSSLVLEAGGSEDEAIAGLLHDAVEDTPATAAEITSRFGAAVASIVVACSDTDVQPKPPWRARKEQYLEHLDDPSTPEPVLRVSAADKLHNARAILADHREVGDDLWGRFNVGAEGQLWYYRALADVFSRRLPGPLSRELSRTVAALAEELESAP